MESSAKIMKATGVIHIVHGCIMGVLMAILILSGMPYIKLIWLLLLLALAIGLSFLYIYIGYELFALRNPDKTKNLLIAAIILACLEVGVATFRGETAGIIFVLELIMSIIAFCNLDQYKKYKGVKDEKKPLTKKPTKKTDTNTHHDKEDDEEYFDDEI